MNNNEDLFKKLESNGWKKIDVWLAGDPEGTKVKKELKFLKLIFAFAFCFGVFFLYLSLRYINSVTRIVVLCCGIFILTTIFLVYRVIIEDSKYFLKNNRKIIFYFKRSINEDYSSFVNELINNYSDYYIMKLVDESYIIFKLEDLSDIDQYVEYRVGESLAYVRYKQLLNIYKRENVN